MKWCAHAFFSPSRLFPRPQIISNKRAIDSHNCEHTCTDSLLKIWQINSPRLQQVDQSKKVCFFLFQFFFLLNCDQYDIIIMHLCDMSVTTFQSPNFKQRNSHLDLYLFIKIKPQKFWVAQVQQHNSRRMMSSSLCLGHFEQNLVHFLNGPVSLYKHASHNLRVLVEQPSSSQPKQHQ